MKRMKKGLAIFMSLLMLSSCGILRPVSSETESEPDAASTETETASAGLSFESILADYEARQDSASSDNAVHLTQTSAVTIAQDGENRPAVSYSDKDLDDSIPANAVQVTLSGTSAAFQGSGISLSDGVLTITEEGVYLLTGSFSGQIKVDAGKNADVRLILSEVTLCAPMAPIYVVSADKVVLTLADGTQNTVEDSADYVFADGEDEPDAAIYSKEDLTINGTGSLTVTGRYQNGIVSKDDLKIVDGRITVNAVYNGIKGKDSLTVRDGEIAVTAGNDAMKASNDTEEERGWVVFEGGSTTISAGDDAIHAETWLIVTGGTIDIQKSKEGLEAMKVEIYGGDIAVVSSDDAINAASGSSGENPFGGFGGFQGDMTPPDGDFGGMTPPDGNFGGMTPPDGNFGGMTPPDGNFGDMTPPDGDFGGMTPPDGDFGGMTPPDSNFGGMTPPDDASGGMPRPNTSSEQASDSADTLFGRRGGGKGNGGQGNGGLGGGGFGGGMPNEQAEEGVWILIAGGTIRAEGGNDILDSNGTFTQTGGTIITDGVNMSIYGEPDAILDTNGSAAIKGGTFAAFCRSTGNSYSSILSSPAVACSSLNGAETVTLADADGNVLMSFANGTRAKNVVITSDAMTAGQDYMLILDGRTISFTASEGVLNVK
ncbi:MAG: carbohydrate-binding domain-containing protein [Clostridia bacterium]|nr:carbohydrate-binding domain-containing protein [Clostridia bacterium]